MLFSSYIFILAFLPITFACYFLLAQCNINQRVSKQFLVLASLFFYGYWNPTYLFLIISSILANFYIGELLIRENLRRYRKFFFTIGLVFNIGLLVYFKYFDFFIVNLNSAFGYTFEMENLILPLAISFFTFQQIAFITERYKQNRDKYSFLDYSLFVVFFPQLIAGPIVQPKDTIDQFADNSSRKLNPQNILCGLLLFSIGLFKKIIIADSFSEYVSSSFDMNSGAHMSLEFLDAWLAALSYTFQLYFDFSGYTDMALGLGLLFNIKLPVNFNSPYKALSIQDFWRRWHITLSNFLRDYIYIPLGGGYVIKTRVYANLLITFILGGLWHGAGWTFVVWGLMHGVALCIHRLWTHFGYRMPKILAWPMTMIFVVVAWVFFRASSLDVAIEITKSMFDLSGAVVFLVGVSTYINNILGNIQEVSFTGMPIYFMLMIKLIGCLVICLFCKNTNEMIFTKLKSGSAGFSSLFIIAVSCMFVTAFLFISLQTYTEFIYFNF